MDIIQVADRVLAWCSSLSFFAGLVLLVMALASNRRRSTRWRPQLARHPIPIGPSGDCRGGMRVRMPAAGWPPHDGSARRRRSEHLARSVAIIILAGIVNYDSPMNTALDTAGALAGLTACVGALLLVDIRAWWRQHRAVAAREQVQAARIAWAQRLRAAVRHEDMTARGERLPSPRVSERRLGEALSRLGLHVSREVPIPLPPRHRRPGNPYTHYKLDYAVRNPRTHMMIDVECDGEHHNEPNRVRSDKERDEYMQGRGWYVVRVPSDLIHYGRAHEVAQLVDRLARLHDDVMLRSEHATTPQARTEERAHTRATS